MLELIRLTFCASRDSVLAFKHYALSSNTKALLTAPVIASFYGTKILMFSWTFNFEILSDFDRSLSFLANVS